MKLTTEINELLEAKTPKFVQETEDLIYDIYDDEVEVEADINSRGSELMVYPIERDKKYGRITFNPAGDLAVVAYDRSQKTAFKKIMKGLEDAGIEVKESGSI